MTPDEQSSDSLTPTPSRRPWMLFSLISSIGLLVAGFGLVLIVLHLHVAPLYDSFKCVRSRCFIFNISMSQGDGIKLQPFNESYNLKWQTREGTSNSGASIPLDCSLDKIAALSSRNYLASESPSSAEVQAVNRACLSIGVCYTKKNNPHIYPGILHSSSIFEGEHRSKSQVI